jgi:hypothetical protein
MVQAEMRRRLGLVPGPVEDPSLTQPVEVA